MEYPDIPQLSESEGTTDSADENDAREYEGMYRNMWMSWWDQLMVTGEEATQGWDDQDYQYPE